LEQAFLKDVLDRLEETGIPYAVTGSIASNLWGTPRTTHDVDIVIVLLAGDVLRLTSAFATGYYISEPAVTEAAARKSMFNVVDFNSGLKADF